MFALKTLFYILFYKKKKLKTYFYMDRVKRIWYL